MSIPSSRLEVATTALSRPVLSSSSTWARCSLDTDPWWARASGSPSSSARSAPISLIRAVSFSASRREFANTMVEECASIRSTMRFSTSPQMLLFSRLAMSGTGTWTVRSKVLSDGGATILAGLPPVRKRATSSAGRTVAESPMRWAGVASSVSRRSSERARCAPRLVAATACTSSTITHRTPARVSRAAEVSIRNSDSGVVMRMSGGFLRSSRRWAGGVSPERTPTRIGCAGAPAHSAMREIPASGVRRLRSTSIASAFSGEM